MESNHVRDLMEAYSSIYAENEEVEQLDEDFQGAVKGALEAGARKTNEFMKKYPVVGAIGAALSPAGPGRKTPTKTSGGYRPVVKSTVGEEIDLFDIIKGHLLDEGFADTEEAALAIMTNMSEGWKQSIVEAVQIPPIGKPQKYIAPPSSSTPRPDMSTPKDKEIGRRISQTPIGMRLTGPTGPLR